MSQNKVYLAVDLGAGSGRVLAGEFDGNRIELHELNRFDNIGLQLPSGVHCNITLLYQNILEGLRIAADTYGDSVISIGIDTWGVDYGLFDKDGRLLGLPYNYRDSRTDGMMEKALEKASREEIYEATGVEFLFFNSLYQLLSEVENRSPALEIAEDMLFIPDMLGYWLTGEKTQERSFASTTQLYNPKKKDWDFNLIEKLGLPKRLFKKISDSGNALGPLRDQVAERTGLKNVKVITVAGHDTASAVAAVPSQAETPAYLSSGTWSLLGLELPEPVITEQSLADGFTNEIGVNNTVRFLKNICGLWLIQETKRYWRAGGEDVPYSKMAGFAASALPFRSLINPDDKRFIEAGRMPEKIQQFCNETGQPIPETKGEIIRCIYESLALRYATVWKKLIQYTDHKPQTLHIVGGGCQDKLLNQFAANSIGVNVAACPVEATGLGNILVQMLANGEIKNLSEGRKIILNSSLVERFEPEDQVPWAEAKIKFEAICK
ncbi:MULTISPECIES: rhamnulokinase family protein [unclassified Lentimonas]|uniref:rhamnulokinase n=1 Tax=unclassified Lentimonas TaxID=2630993 RepID=UPI00132C4DBD|nr:MULTISPECIES: rhamnulokinase family protein [unclassified Lentimonas]CAA6679136.1 Rhamnulokinase (EC [Lentimonas sp. CC4]CAA6684120.1 Rhamnulokinase (EC [Lentimonas sp. CC6]CAA6694442.1 Rhamnulokinase (EC [Lentimonas sp. CC19]CAA6697085.1 Rhamnulokinase (EC [Lentimonas sp. CC10]CAA7069534.1 Rhamnulokinase (EC [Lentimonas sp. CC11]